MHDEFYNQNEQVERCVCLQSVFELLVLVFSESTMSQNRRCDDSLLC
jgi:hypothetical protein